MRISAGFMLIVTAAAAAGCADLDSFVWNPRHCTVVTDDLCADKEMCTECGGALPFDKWGIPEDAVTQHPIDLGDGETNDSWFVQSRGGALSDITIIYSHGNFGGLEHYLNRVGQLYLTGANVYAVDYRGFGQSSTPSEPSEEQFMSDTHKARDGVADILVEHGVSPTKLVVMGYSAGALSAVEMAVTDDNCGLVLEASWPSAQAFTDDSTFIGVPGSFVTTGQWDNISKMASYEKPYLHFHGDNDQTVRLALGERVFDASPSTRKELVVVKTATHGNFLGKDGEEKDVPAVLGDDVFAARIADFIDDLDCR